MKNHLPELTKRFESLLVEERNKLATQTDVAQLIKSATSLIMQGYLFAYLKQLEQAGARLEIPEEYLKAFNVEGD